MRGGVEAEKRSGRSIRRVTRLLVLGAAVGAVLTVGSPVATATDPAGPRVVVPAVGPTVDATEAATVAKPVPVTAPAPAPTTPEGKGAAALTLISYPIERTGFTVVFAGPRKGYLGLTEAAPRRITVFVRDTQSVADVARILSHELGHVVDLTLTTAQERNQYRAIRGLAARSPWYPSCPACTDYGSPAGDFAETFAWWLVGPGHFRSTVAAAPTDAELTQLATIFAA